MGALDITPRLMKARHAAQYLGVSESTLRTLPIPRKEVGGLRLYDRADLDEWADAQPYEGHSAPASATKSGAPKPW